MALSRAQKQHINQEMFALVDFLMAQGVAFKEAVQAMGQLRDDMVSAYTQGIELHTVKESYLLQKEG